MKLVLVLIAVLLLSPAAHSDALDQWLTHTSPVPVILQDVVYAKGLFVAIGMDTGSSIARLIVSSNGTDWVRFASQSQVALRALAYGTNGLFVGVGRAGDSDGADNPGVIVSTTGTNWSFFQPFGSRFGTKTNFEGVTYGNGLFVAVGDNGIVATSRNGTNWATHTTPTTYPLTGIAYGNGVWVATGPKEPDAGTGPRSPGPRLVSTDGTNWVQLDTDFNGARVLFARGMFLALAGDTFNPNLRPMRYSLDGTNWFNIAEPAIHIMSRAAYGGGIFTAVGRNVIKTSVDGTNWVLRYPANSDVTNRLRSVAYGTNTFVAVGDVILQSDDIRPRWNLRPSINSEDGSISHRGYLTGITNALYAIERSTNAVDWFPISTNRMNRNEILIFNSAATHIAIRFHRAFHVPE